MSDVKAMTEPSEPLYLKHQREISTAKTTALNEMLEFIDSLKGSVTDARAEVERVNNLHKSLMKMADERCETAESALSASLLEAERNRVDAERYTWLRSHFASPHANRLIQLSGLQDIEFGSLDAAIDAARTA